MTVAYFDIETTGLSPKNDDVTIIGIMSNNKLTQFVSGVNLKKYILSDYIIYNNITEIIGYNNIRFDIPFVIANDFLSKKVNHGLIKTDLMNTCHKLGMKGGLKATEIKLGIMRKAEPLNFWQQQALWKKWNVQGDSYALSRYKFYNEEDITNLPLIEQKLEQLKEQKRIQHEQFMKIFKEKKGLK